MVATVSIVVVGRTYEISCDEGQEDDVRALAAEVDRRAAGLLRAVGQVGDARLLVMVGLTMADEIAELRRQQAVPAAAPGVAPAAAAPPGVSEADLDHLDGDLAERLEILARHVEAIAERVEKA